jgi:hypothetical protein
MKQRKRKKDVEAFEQNFSKTKAHLMHDTHVSMKNFPSTEYTSEGAKSFHWRSESFLFT